VSRANVLRALRLLLGLGLLGWLCTRVPSHELATLARKTDGGQLALALVLLFVANPFVQTLRLHVLVARYTERLWTSFEVYAVGSFFNLTLPSNVGGDAVKLLYLKRMRAENWAAPFVLLLLHRFTGIMLLLVAAAGYALASHARFAALMREARIEAHVPAGLLVAAVAASVLCVLGFFALSTTVRARVLCFARKFLADCGQALLLVGARGAMALLALTVGFHFLRMLAFSVLVSATGQHVELLDLLIVLAFTAVAGMLPLSVGGLGLMEGAVSVTLGWFGVSESAALATALAQRLVLLLGAAIGGVFYVAARGRRAS